MNNVNLIGRLVKDSDLADIGANKTPKMTFTIAVDDGFGDNKRTYFIQCELWGKRAESLFDYMVKGTQVAVNGKLTTGSYDNKEGKKVYTTTVNVNEVDLLKIPKTDEPKDEPKEEPKRTTRTRTR